MAAFAPTALAITQDLAPPNKRATTIGKYLTSIGVATTIGPFLCTFLVNYVNYTQLFQIASIIPPIGLVPFLLIRPKSAHTPNPKKTNLSLFTSLKTIFSSRNMLILTYLRLTFSFTYAFFITLFAIYAENTLLLLPALIALLFGIRGLTNMLSRIPSGRIADKIGYKIPIITAFTLLTITFLTISQTDNIYFLILAMIIYGAAHGIRAVSEWSMLGDYAPSEAGTVATAYLSTMFSVGAALGAVAAGALTIILDTQTIFKIAAIITLTGALAINLTRTTRQTPN
jgi:predicted MFS family arabinose efflux permease